MYDELLTDIVEELKIEMEIVEETDIAILTIKVKNAIREVEHAINFQPHHTDERKLNEVSGYIPQIKKIAMYDFTHIGGEMEAVHSENGIARTWVDRKECFRGITRYADL